MGTEFERKYLVTSDAWRSEVRDSFRIAQGYLGISAAATIRVRITDVGAWLTIKGRRTGIARAEFEYPVPAADAALMLSELSASAIDKTRHLLRHEVGEWTVDVFHGANTGLALLEIEHFEEFSPESLPGWVGAEVTEDDRFTNAFLSEHPYNQWPAH